jgi:hypothetical protein
MRLGLRLPNGGIQVGVSAGVWLLPISFSRRLFFQFPQGLADGIPDEFRSLPCPARSNALELCRNFVVQFDY